MTMLSETDTTPWYKQFWPWFIMSLPASAVVAGIITIIIAVNNPDGLVEDDYYKAGLAINKVLAKEQKAADLGVNAIVKWDTEKGQLELKLTSSTKPDDRLLLKMLHPTRENRDIEVPLIHQGDGRYAGMLDTTPVQGNWNLILMPVNESWRLTSRARLPDETRWELAY